MEGLGQEAGRQHRHNCPGVSGPCLYRELKKVDLQGSLEARQGSLKEVPEAKKEGFRKDGAPHQAQQVEEEVGVLANEVVGLAAKVNKIMEAAGRLVTPIDDIRHVRGEDKGGTVPGPRGTYR